MRNISAKNYLKHQHALPSLNSILLILSDSNRMFTALDQIDEWFNSVVTMVNELDEQIVKCGAFLKKDEQ